MPPRFHQHRQAAPSAGTRADHEFRRRLVRVLLLLAVLLVAGTSGYMIIEGWRPLGETAIWGPDGVKVLAVGRQNGELVTSPRQDLRLEAGDVLIALGTPEQLEAARQVAGDREGTTPAPAGRGLRSRSRG